MTSPAWGGSQGESATPNTKQFSKVRARVFQDPSLDLLVGAETNGRATVNIVNSKTVRHVGNNKYTT